MEKTEHKTGSKAISRIYDYASRSFTTELAAGALIGVHGKNLMPEEGDPSIMLNLEGTEEMIPMGTILDVSERMVMGNLPADLSAGTYTVFLVKLSPVGHIPAGFFIVCRA